LRITQKRSYDAAQRFTGVFAVARLPRAPRVHVRIARVANRTESLNNKVHLRGTREFALRHVT